MDIIGQNGNDGEHYSILDLNQDGIISEDEIKIIKGKIKKIHNKVGGNLLSHPEELKRIKKLEKELKNYEKDFRK